MDILDDEVLKRLATDTSRGRFPVLIAAFLKEIEKCTEQLNAAVSERDEGKVREIAHVLKSVSGTFGATRLYESSTRIEQAAIEEKACHNLALIDHHSKTVGDTVLAFTELNSKS
ncbi:Hpt domain-containing protein [Marinobacter sp.]|jgi:two-component system, sensor histidine kinase and response regulator|uniref:Hpt domain-containing protein n=1 Tax=Marinobacter sp. TaxID=50741 RepID=UPI00260D8029|nr:Hpt domain-containing protein [Marinobacter sp.]|tara:strand:+ start:133 stop:477 length:345 start_codon:yes stop_codon:yes gene_type:complete